MLTHKDVALEEYRNLITHHGQVLAQLSASCFTFSKTPPSPALVMKPTPLVQLCALPRIFFGIIFLLTQSKDSPSLTPDTLFFHFLTCVLLPMSERGFPPLLAKEEKGHFDGNSLPNFPLVLVCCCSPSKEKKKQSVQTTLTAQFEVQASALGGKSKPFHL